MLESKFYSTCQHSLRRSSGPGPRSRWRRDSSSGCCRRSSRRFSSPRSSRTSSIPSPRGSTRPPRRRVPRPLAVVRVLLLAVAVAVAMMLVVLPLFYKETRLLMEKLPGFVAWFNTHDAAWIQARLELDVRLHRDDAD